MKLLDNNEFYRLLEHRKSEGTLCKTSLIVAPQGCGRGFAARVLAAYHLCDDQNSIDTLLEKANGEIMVLEGEGASGDIKIEKVREVRRKAYETSLDGKGRVVIVKEAAGLNRSSANALLKIMEEPPAGLLFILTASSIGELPATLVSRCSKYNISPVSEETTMEHLKKLKLGERERELLFSAFNGRLGSINHFSETKKRRNLLLRSGEAVDSALTHSSASGYRLLCAFSGKGNDDRFETRDLLYCVSSLFIAAAKGVYGNTDKAMSCYKADSAVQGAMALLKKNVNQKSVLSVLCEDIKEAFNE